MNTKKAIYPGSFDPITHGHLDILDRSLNLFSEVTLLVAQSANKKPFFTLDERVQILKEVTHDKKGVKVDCCTGLIMDYAKKNSIHTVIRGLRAASDFEYEFMMVSMNKSINPNLETLFMMTTQNLFFVSSSVVKELFQYGVDVSPYVPFTIIKELKRKMDQNTLSSC